MSPTVPILDERVPVPDPDGIEALAARCCAIATQLEEMRSLVQAMGSVPDWRGTAADAFEIDVRVLTRELTAAQGSFNSAQQALAGYGDAARAWVGQYSHVAGQANDVHAEYRATLVALQQVEGTSEAAAVQARAVSLLEELEQLQAQLGQLYDIDLPALGGACASAIRNAESAVVDLGLPGMPPSNRALQRALSAFQTDTPTQFLRRLAAMTPQERAGFLAHLSDADLHRWDLSLSFLTFVMDFFDPGAAQQFRLELTNLLLASATSAELARLEQEMPYLFPNPTIPKRKHDAGVFPTGWMSLAGFPLFDPSTGAPSLEDINQGGDGDCYFMSSLNAVAMADPRLIEDNIRANANGTYTVTFYENGHPVQVTVTDDVPESDMSGFDWTDGEAYSYSYPGADNAQWALIYEKAYAELNGGYAAISGGLASTALPTITGQSDQGLSPGVRTLLSSIQSDLHNGDAIAAGSMPEPKKSTSGYADGGQVVYDHEYMVQTVDLGANPPTITLVNPWGQGQIGAPQGPYQVTLTQAQFARYFVSVDAVHP